MARYHCINCDYEGPCYGAPGSEGVSAPWCPKCGRNHKLEPLIRWRMKQETIRQRRSMQLFIVSVITAALCLTVLYFAVSVWVVEEAKGDELPEVAPRTSMVRSCYYLYDKPGKHREWAECMGVGYD